MAPIEFYLMPDSPPCRTVQMTLAALGLETKEHVLNYEKNDHLNPEFVKINPQHTVPTIKDGDLILWESRAIITYLVDKYAKDDSLYPRDPLQRALVDQRLYFDMGTLYQRYIDFYFPMIMEKAPADPEKYKKLKDAFSFLDTFLEGSKYAAGGQITLADYSLVISVSSIVEGGPNFSLAKYPNVQRWYEDCKKSIKEYPATEKALELVKLYFVDCPPAPED